MSNRITAYFKGRIGVAESVYQNDSGLIMVFDSIDLPAHFDCYFSRLNQEESFPGVGADNMVAIPNDILANPGNITVHIPLHTSANDSEVEYIVYFKIIGRARPMDDGTPTQMTAIEQALALLQNPITNIEQIVNEALAFTGETFEEMQEDLDEWKTDTEEGLETWKGGVESDFDILQAQFDTAVGAVTTDTEVTDIRVGADGVTDTTAGASVRRQFTDLKSEKEDSVYTKEYIEGTLVDGKWITKTLTEYTSALAVYRAVDVVGGNTYYISGTDVSTTYPLAVLVDSSNNVLSTIHITNNTIFNDYQIAVPSNCAKVYINGRKYDSSSQNYPSIYYYDHDTDGLNDIVESIANKQFQTKAWDESTTLATGSGEYAKITDSGVTIVNDEYSGAYTYAKISYDKTKKYRFWGLCKSAIIPCIICCDSNGIIIKFIGNTVGTVYKGEIVTSIPDTTSIIYINGSVKLVARAEIARERSVVSLIDSTKVGVCFGDSITQGNNVYIDDTITPYQDYPSVMAELLGCTIYNGGLGGSTYSSGRVIDLVNVIQCVVSGDFSSVITGIDTYNLNDSAKLQYAEIADLDFSDGVDFVTFAFGTNDWNFGRTADDVKTAMRTCISTLLTAFPKLKIYIITPIYRFNVQESGEDSNVFVNPSSGLTLHQMCEAIIDVAKEYNLPYKDLYYSCNINTYTKTLYMGDDTHPNANGYAIIGNKIGKFINAN